MKEIIIKNNDAGQRFDKMLKKHLNQATSGFIYKMLRKKNITLNNKKADGSEILKTDDVVKIFFSDETYNRFVSNDVKDYGIDEKNRISLDIVYEDEDVIFINKPAGMLSQKSSKDDVSLNEHIIDYLLCNGKLSKEELTHFRPSVCNRLDRNTSGLISAGKSLKGLQALSFMFKERTADKYYLAIVKGRLEKDLKLEGYLEKDNANNKVSIHKIKTGKSDEAEGDYICTEYTVVKANDEISLLKVKLITGKTHQIRAHLSSIGHPIIGDYKYGDRKFNLFYENKYKFKGQLLHSYELKVDNDFKMLEDISGKRFIANLPGVFKKILSDELEINIKNGVL